MTIEEIKALPKYLREIWEYMIDMGDTTKFTKVKFFFPVERNVVVNLDDVRSTGVKRIKKSKVFTDSGEYRGEILSIHIPKINHN